MKLHPVISKKYETLQCHCFTSLLYYLTISVDDDYVQEVEADEQCQTI